MLYQEWYRVGIPTRVYWEAYPGIYHPVYTPLGGIPGYIPPMYTFLGGREAYTPVLHLLGGWEASLRLVMTLFGRLGGLFAPRVFLLGFSGSPEVCPKRPRNPLQKAASHKGGEKKKRAPESPLRPPRSWAAF